MSVAYIENVALAVDQLGNTFLAGKPDETLSARCYRSARREERLRDAGEDYKRRWSYAEKFVDWLFLPQDWLVKRRGEWTGARHCERAYVKEVQRKHLPPAYREVA